MSATVDLLACRGDVAARAAGTYRAAAYAAVGPGSGLSLTSIRRREPGPRDVQIDVLYCGVCRSDVVHARGAGEAASDARAPIVPGHEIVGRVARTGREVTRFAVGDIAAVGRIVNACGTCSACEAGAEQRCERPPAPARDGSVVGGGYATSIVVDEALALAVPFALRSARGGLAGVAPLLCAGIGAYAPLSRWNAGPGHKVGIVGLAGPGHLGVKLASVLGAHVVLLARRNEDVDEGFRLGADEVIVARDAAALRAHAGNFDFILHTAWDDEPDPYLDLLKRDAAPLAHPRLTRPAIGGIAETQEMLDFCAEQRITADVEIVGIRQVDAAFERLLAGDVRHRFVIDMATLRDATRATPRWFLPRCRARTARSGPATPRSAALARSRSPT